MLYTKSAAAFLLSARKLYGIGDKVYFWTFTFKNVYPDWWYPASWRIFARKVHNWYDRDVYGLRVIEIHPRGHGLHYHLLVNRRMPIHFVRRVCEPLGIFWIHVSRFPTTPGTASYLAKYLKKDFATKLHGMHRWESFGSFRAVRVHDVVIESPYMRARRRWVKTRVPYGYEELLRRVFELHGGRGLRECAKKLRAGRLMSAATMVSPHVAITPKGGLKYFKPLRHGKSFVKVISVKST